ncbi:hypothetical protein [Leifsonia sp. NPDC058248]|uniref:hypothetical protein n=1 Tax=Leifsonia sp. NPDC058248 TaxID=3346402 RepID=UPI0036DE72CD
MSPTRKRTKELKRLRSSAEELWGAQQDLLANANAVAAEARRQAANYTREELAPRVRDGYHTYVRPAAQSARQAASEMAGSARDRLVSDVIPAVGATIGTAMSVVDHARDARARAFIGDVRNEVRSAGKDISKKAQAVTEKSGPSAGTVIAVGLGIIAAIGLLYAVWQTFRADDELWVADEEPTAPVAE